MDAPHGRYPVGRGSLDRLDGVVHVRDLVAAPRDGAHTIGALARPALIVPETKDVGALLRELRERRQQLAVVVDEYGAVAGVVTIEDVLEEIVGEIQDEFDLPDDRLDRIDERTVPGGRLDHRRRLQRGDRDRAAAGRAAHARRARRSTRSAGVREVGDAVELAGTKVAVEAVDGLRITGLLVTLPDAAAG